MPTLNSAKKRMLTSLEVAMRYEKVLKSHTDEVLALLRSVYIAIVVGHFSVKWFFMFSHLPPLPYSELPFFIKHKLFSAE